MGNNARQGTPANAGHAGVIQCCRMLMDSPAQIMTRLRNNRFYFFYKIFGIFLKEKNEIKDAGKLSERHLPLWKDDSSL